MRRFSLLLKPASADCNLRCDYCFYLNRAALYPDSTPHRMSGGVLERVIQSYLATGQPQYDFGWQGGEPALMGVEFFRRVTDLQQKHGKNGALIANSLQTNATLIQDELAKHLGEYNFLVGLSLDGPAAIHDRYRRSAQGRGSHADVLAGMEILRKHGVAFNVLTLVNAANVHFGRDIYNYLRDLGIYYHQYIPCVEFNAEGRPAPFAITGAQWGDFLCAVFDAWRRTDTRRVSVRLFDAVLAVMAEGRYNVCHMGGDCNRYFVVEYNGDVYPCDFFVEPRLKLGNIMEASWEELLNAPAYFAFGRKKVAWDDQCFSCPYLAYCSGDCPRHRLQMEGTPPGPGWLCEGWRRFYSHALPIFQDLLASIPGYKRRPEIGRNEPCNCGSGRKYKKCHGTVQSR